MKLTSCRPSRACRKTIYIVLLLLAIVIIALGTFAALKFRDVLSLSSPGGGKDHRRHLTEPAHVEMTRQMKRWLEKYGTDLSLLWESLQQPLSLQQQQRHQKLEKAKPSELSPHKYFRFNIIHTSDLHSSFDGHGPAAEQYSHKLRGHYARLAYLIKALRSKGGASRTLTLDAGDWYNGSFFALLSMSYMYQNANLSWLKLPIELRFLDDLGYDATTLGNHDLDGTERGLSKMILAARNSDLKVPIVISNLENLDEQFDSAACIESLRKLVTPSNDSSLFSASLPRGFDADTSRIERPTSIVPFVLKQMFDENTNKTLKVGVMGLFGLDANLVSLPMRNCLRMTGYDTKTATENWESYVKLAYDTSMMLRREHGVDVVVAMTHSGEPEDDEVISLLHLYQKRLCEANNDTSTTCDFSRPVIDVMISSHTHSIFLYKHSVDGTIVSQSGPYGTKVGYLQLAYDFEQKRVLLLNGHVPIRKTFYPDRLKSVGDFLVQPRIPIGAHIPFDEEQLAMIRRYTQLIDDAFLSDLPYRYNTPIGSIRSTGWKNKQELVRWVTSQLERELCAEVRQQAAAASNSTVAAGTPCTDIAFYMTGLSSVRFSPKSLFKANSTEVTLQFSDIYKVFGVGSVNENTNPQNLPGTPITIFYIKKDFLPSLIESEYYYSWVKPIMTLSYSDSLTWKIRPYGIPFINRFYDIRIHGVPLDEMPPLLRVATPSWVAGFLFRVRDFTMGLFDFPLYDAHGNRLTHEEFLASSRTPFYEYILFSNALSKQHKMKETIDQKD